jgi:phosphoenolpyruvate synthase/pyruvate phosphate dikinase
VSDADVLRLAEYAIRIEDHYGQPMDIEWARDAWTAASTSFRCVRKRSPRVAT